MSDGRVLVIGDLHGCYEELCLLLEKCKFDKSKDRLISAGDLVDRGPYPRECVDFIMNNAECVMGNHEERMIKYYEKWLKKGSPINQDIIDGNLDFRSPEHRRSFHSLESKHFEWMKTLPLFIRLPEHDAVVVHAGCLPEIPLEKQDPFMLMHISCIKPPYVGYKEGSLHISHGYWSPLVESWWPSKAPPDARFWPAFYDGSHGRVIFGHTGLDDPFITEHTLGIDCGACFGRMLTAVILPGWDIVSVPARKKYYDSKGRTKKYEAMPGLWIWS